MGLPGIKYDKIQDFGLSTDGRFLAITDGGAAYVVHHDAQTSSLWPEALAKTENLELLVFIGRTFTTQVSSVSGSVSYATGNLESAPSLVIQLLEGKGSILIAVALRRLGETHENTRVLLTTTTGSIQLWQRDKMQWVREEALASIQVAEFVELAKRTVVTSHAVDEEGYFERLQRHPMPGHRGYIQRGHLC
ncbi:hypothetical protein M405DRAFT_848078 [Rhizopogon salebrosus TDB-379]|nr:hypothetical protein M405DRAFT_848078 [Rhizopogon salebrosus TDB-379]